MPVRPQETVPTLLQVDAILVRLTGTNALAEVARFLRAQFHHYRWVGAYRRKAGQLELVAYDGELPTSSGPFPMEEATFGRAATTGRGVLVPDRPPAGPPRAVGSEARCLLVVPLKEGADVTGFFEVDGDHERALDASDQRLLEAIGAKLGSAARAAPPVEGPA